MIDTSNERVKRLAADLYGFANAEKRAEAADMLLALVEIIRELKARAETAESGLNALKADWIYREAELVARTNTAELLVHQWEHDAKFWKNRAARIVTAYDRDNPARTADAHASDCPCLRCAIDNVRATWEIKP